LVFGFFFRLNRPGYEGERIVSRSRGGDKTLTHGDCTLDGIDDLTALLQVLRVVESVLLAGQDGGCRGVDGFFGGRRNDAETFLKSLEFRLCCFRCSFFACWLAFEMFCESGGAKVSNGVTNLRRINVLFCFLDSAETTTCEIAARVVVAGLLAAHATAGSA
jgi:hypothetical protein